MSSSTTNKPSTAPSGSLLSSWLPSWSGSKATPSAAAPDSTSPQQQQQQPASQQAEHHNDLTNTTDAAQPDFNGQWEKDTAASDMDAYAKQVAMLHMSSVQTYAALHFMWGLDIKSDDQGFTLRFLVKKVPAFVFREVEHYSFDQQTDMPRRDRRSGQQTGTLTHVDGGVQVDVKWGDPYAAVTREVYTLQSPTRMHLNSDVTVGGEIVSSLQVYNKK